MNRLTKKANHYCDTDIDNEYKFADEDTSIGEIVDKLGQLEDLEEELDVDLVEFVSELIYVLKHSNQTKGYTSKGKEITTDYGYVEEFIEDLKEAIKGKSE